MSSRDPLRAHVLRVLDWNDAHVGFDEAVKGFAPEFQGVQPEGLPYSPWQLLEHMRIAQHDILDFCRNPSYEKLKWPDDYWPRSAAPPHAKAWDDSLVAFRRDREELKQLAADPSADLFAQVPHGSGQTYLREMLLVADHNAYHLGQLMTVRRLLGLV